MNRPGPASLTPENIEVIRADVKAGLMEDGFAEADARAAVARENDPTFSKMYAGALSWLKHGSGHRAIETQQLRKGKTVTKAATEEKRICSGAKFHGRKPQKANADSRSQPGNPRKVKSNGHAAPIELQSPDDPITRSPGKRTLPLQVSEEVVNIFLTGLPFEDKIAMAQSWFAREYSIGAVTHTFGGRVESERDAAKASQ